MLYDGYGQSHFEGEFMVRPTQLHSRYYIVEYKNSRISSYFLVNLGE